MGALKTRWEDMEHVGACMLAEYERVVTPLRNSVGNEEMTLHGSSGDTEMER